MTDQPAPCACPSLPMHAATCPALADLWPGVAPSGPAGVSLGGGGTCDASVTAYGGEPFGPCILRHQHDGPVHKAADGTTWTTHTDGDEPLGRPECTGKEGFCPAHGFHRHIPEQTAATDPLAPFRALADQYAAKAAESTRNANTAPLTIRTANQGIAAGWRSAEFLLRHTLTDLDNGRTTPDNPADAVLAAIDEPATAALDAAYRERARLVAHLASLYPSHIGHTDPSAPDWAVVIVETPAGQMSWHIAERDLPLFAHVRRTDRLCCGWDGHTADEKYERLEALIRGEGTTLFRAEHSEAAVARVRALHVRNANAGVCEHCSAGAYPDYAVSYPCPTIQAVNGPTETGS